MKSCHELPREIYKCDECAILVMRITGLEPVRENPSKPLESREKCLF